MALPALIQAAIDRIRAANGNSYDPDTNPGGLAQGGHRQNFVPDLNAVADIGGFVADRAAASDANAALTAEDANNTEQDRIATSQDRTAAAGSAQAAAASAAGVNLPAVTGTDAGKFLAVKSDGSGYEPKALTISVASKAQAEAGTSNTVFMIPLRTAEAIAELGANVAYEVFTASGAFTKEDDDLAYHVELWNGGASGSAAIDSSANTAVAGSQGGNYNTAFFAASEVGAKEIVTIGAGGAAVVRTAGGTAPGLPGGITSFGSLLSGNPSYPTTFAAGSSSTIPAGSQPGTFPGSPGFNKGGAGGAGKRDGASVTAQNGLTPGGAGGSALAFYNSGYTATSGAGARGEIRIRRFKK